MSRGWQSHKIGRRENMRRAFDVGSWVAVLSLLAFVIGTACASFLWALDWATKARLAHPELLFVLPLSGALVAFCYEKLGRSPRGNHASGGSDLLIEEIHRPSAGVPLRMTPLILMATILTHLCGGSAGREGTAVQMGGSLASAMGRSRAVRFLNRNANGQALLAPHTLLMAGIAAGFGGVFGTPLAGAVFALEVLAVGTLRFEAIGPCLFAALVGDWTCRSWGIAHETIGVAAITSTRLDVLLTLKIVVASVAFGLTSRFFAASMHATQHFFERTIRSPVLRPVVGGTLVIALVFLLGTHDYLGIGTVAQGAHSITIASSFEAGGAQPLSWLWKLVFTVTTLGSGFKGGEVTPLFFIGAALGNVLAALFYAPVALFAALGFVAVFAGAAKTPLACTLMGIELFGSSYAPFLAIACFIAFLCSGKTGIYKAQRAALGAQKRDLATSALATSALESGTRSDKEPS